MNTDSRPLAQRTFESRHSAPRHIANLSPNRVSAADIADLTNTHIRTAQKMLKDLTEWGYLIADKRIGGCNPIGYKLNEEKRGGLEI
ncbi:helix-turn-helix domain-containing protein [Psychrobacter aquaticus]|uniref:Uncharacterized protein n=1 Tax=Psychrobacter aquaticus CMS 56 TaxID=1354303 RepID=U4T2W4_9GAMM|nr:HTH domain-containing protein [Psychrobacter aquaticus]ERL54970.1 hypothetical protein M917_2316 [Psychrobacter aquaticus CMS 56]